MKSVRRLEQQIQGKLFDRAGRGKKLTPVGHVLLDRARALSRTVANMESDVRDYARGAAGTVRIGTGTTPAEHIMPAAGRRLAAIAPGIRLQLTIAMSDRLYDDLRHDDVDLIVCPTRPAADDEFESRVLWHDEMVVAAGADHPLIGQPITLAALAAYEWVLPSRSMSTRAWFDAVFHTRGLAAPMARVETDSLSALPSLVEQMGLLTFIGRGSQRQLQELAHPATTLHRVFAVSTRRERYIPPAVATCLAVLEHTTRGHREGGESPDGGLNRTS